MSAEIKEGKNMLTVSTFVRADRLRLAALFQSKEETRYYLNGVFIHSIDEGVCLAATDGHKMGIFRDEFGFTCADCIVSLPKEARAAIKACKEREFLWFGIIGSHAGFGRREARIFDTGSERGCCTPTEALDLMLDPTHIGVVWSGAVELIDGTFPEYSAIIPHKRAKSAEFMAFDPKKLAPFTEVATDLAPTAVRLFPAGQQEAVLVDCGRGDFVGVLMPVRGDIAIHDDGPFVRPPAWAMTRQKDLFPDAA